MSRLSPRRAATVLTTLTRAGMLAPTRPDRLLGMAAALGLYGITPAGGYAAQAVRDPGRVALVDADGSLTYGEIDRLTNAVAAAFGEDGIGPGWAVGVRCGNARSFVLAVVALGKAGATAVLLNPSMSAPLLADLCESESLTAVVQDDAYADLPEDVPTYWTQDFEEHLRDRGDARPRPPREPGRFVILTSGTTGRPKGAARSAPASLDPMVAVLSVIPLRRGETTVVAAPLFHAWGFAQWLLALALGSTVVLTGAFDPERVLRAVADNEATALVAVPVMLRRLLAVPGEVPSLRVVAVSGSALPPDVATAFLDRFGDVLYDLYGSTEVAWATIATPEDIRLGSVGRPPFGTTVRLFDGRIFVGNDLLVEGMDKEIRDGLMATGDLGRFDDDGRLYVVGREDDMVVSGGENVFPQPVEEAISALPGVADVGVVGVPDEEFGQRLRAVVVRSDPSLTEDAVRDAVRAVLARHYVPRDVLFADALPRNAAGKVLRRELL